MLAAADARDINQSRRNIATGGIDNLGINMRLRALPKLSYVANDDQQVSRLLQVLRWIQNGTVGNGVVVSWRIVYTTLSVVAQRATA